MKLSKYEGLISRYKENRNGGVVGKAQHWEGGEFITCVTPQFNTYRYLLVDFKLRKIQSLLASMFLKMESKRIFGGPRLSTCLFTRENKLFSGTLSSSLMAVATLDRVSGG